MKFSHAISLIVGLLASACAGESGEDTGSTDSGLSESREYYEVTGEGFWQGTYPLETHMVALRVLQPETSTIYEHFIGLGEEEGESYELTATVDLETNAFTIAYLDGSYEGTGVLYGDAWDWHAWESTTTASDGSGSVVSEDTKDENGIVAHKTGYDAEGQESWSMEEVLTPITEDEWLALQEGLE